MVHALPSSQGAVLLTLAHPETGSHESLVQGVTDCIMQGNIAVDASVLFAADVNQNTLTIGNSLIEGNTVLSDAELS